MTTSEPVNTRSAGPGERASDSQEHALRVAFFSLPDAFKRYSFFLSLLAPAPVPFRLLQAAAASNEPVLNVEELVSTLEERLIVRKIAADRILLYTRARDWIREHGAKYTPMSGFSAWASSTLLVLTKELARNPEQHNTEAIWVTPHLEEALNSGKIELSVNDQVRIMSAVAVAADSVGNREKAMGWYSLLLNKLSRKSLEVDPDLRSDHQVNFWQNRLIADILVADERDLSRVELPVNPNQLSSDTEDLWKRLVHVGTQIIRKSGVRLLVRGLESFAEVDPSFGRIQQGSVVYNSYKRASRAQEQDFGQWWNSAVRNLFPQQVAANVAERTAR